MRHLGLSRLVSRGDGNQLIFERLLNNRALPVPRLSPIEGFTRLLILLCLPLIIPLEWINSLFTNNQREDNLSRAELLATIRLGEASGAMCKREYEIVSNLIALSSIRSQVVEPGQGVYAATKAGILQLARALAAELGPQGVRVNAIAPGVVETPLTEPIKSQPDWYNAYAQKNALGRWAKSSELAGPIVFLASDAASYITGAVLMVDGGLTAV